MPLVSYVDTVYCYNYDLRVPPLNNTNDFPPCFHVEKLFPVSWYALPVHAIRQTKSVCAIEHQSVRVLLLVPILLARV